MIIQKVKSFRLMLIQELLNPGLNSCKKTGKIVFGEKYKEILKMVD